MTTPALIDFRRSWQGPHNEDYFNELERLGAAGEDHEEPVVDGDRAVHAEQARGPSEMLPPPSDPMAVARELVQQRYTGPGALTLRHWRGGWWTWAGSHWVEREDRAVRTECYAFTERAVYLTEKGIRPWEPTRFKVGNLLEALAAITHLDETVDQPSWTNGHRGEAVVALANGLLDLERRRLLPHSPHYFNQTAVPFDYQPGAPLPARWLGFLSELWPDDPKSLAALGEFFGYVISGRLDLHKILLIVGPTRGGKGTIARILGKLIGPANVAGPTLSSLSYDFGLAPLLGKGLAVISDARLDASRDSSVVVERLLAISGEDTITVNRKYREQWTGKLPSRFLIVSNELPRLGDASATIANRFVVLLLRESWLDREDHALEPAITAELTGILNWALEGLDRLTEQDRFTRPASTDEAILALQDLASPVAAFVRDQCVTGPAHEVMVDIIFGRWKEWAEANGNRPGSRQTFGRNLRAVVPGLRVSQPRDGESRERQYQGIGLRETSTTHSATDRVPPRSGDSGTDWHAVHPSVGGTPTDDPELAGDDG
jgi:putative DNA primase/helicase